MNFTTKRRILNSSVYIVLGLVIIAVISITAVTLFGMRKSENPPDPAKETTPTASASAAGNFETPPAPEKNVDPSPASPAPSPGAQSALNEETPAGEVIVPVKQVFCLPAAGTLYKEYSAGIPIRSLTMNDYRTHNGVDISAPAGSAVKAAADGVVLDVWSDPMMGVCLSIDHGGGLASVYKNLDTIFPDGIVKGAAVKAGDTVASVGNTCLIELADVDHLHFEMTFNGKHVDPGSYVDLSALALEDASGE